VTLENGIEVRRAANGLYCYRTFIGTVGNLVLAWSIRETYADLGEDVQVAADEIGLSCSRLIDFKLLALPLSDDDLAMFPLNVFCCTLSKELLLRELTSFIRDSRLIDFFKRCHNKSSEIIHGDPKNLDLWPRSVNKNNEQQSLPNIPAQGEPLLTWEKKRRVGRVIPACHPEAGYQVRALTGSLVGSYFRHHQCRRWLCFHFLPPEAQPLCRYSQVDEKLAAGRRARGREWEEKIFSWLNNHCQVFSRIAAKDVRNALLLLLIATSTLSSRHCRLITFCHQRQHFLTTGTTKKLPCLVWEFLPLSGELRGRKIFWKWGMLKAVGSPVMTRSGRWPFMLSCCKNWCDASRNFLN